MRRFAIKRKFEIPQNTNDTMALIAWVIQIFGTLLLHLLITAGFVIGAYFFVKLAILSPFWFTTLLAIVFVAVSLIGLSAIIIDITEIISIIKELRKGNYHNALKFIKRVLMLFLVLVLCVALIVTVSKFSGNNEITPNTTTESTQETVANELPITGLWVYRYNYQTGKSDFASCGYIDQYTTLVSETDESISKFLTGSYMYLGTIKGYLNANKTIEVYQVTLPEISDNFTIANDNIKLDYSGNKKMIEVTGWIYMDGTTILAVSPLYSE